MSQVRETTIVVSAAHADAVIVLIEGNRRRNDNVEPAGVDDETANRLPDAELISFQLSVTRHFAKRHSCAGAQNRHENALVCAPASFDDFACIDFVTHRQEAGDGFAGIPRVCRADTITNNL
mgnify:CR=1 FL=1